MKTTEPTQSEKRIAIAKATGWTKVGEKGFGSKDLVGCRPKETFWAFTPLPDYEKDLNACHEAENAFTSEQHCDFRDHLAKLTSGLGIEGSTRLNISAPAEIRAEAIWRTLCV